MRKALLASIASSALFVGAAHAAVLFVPGSSFTVNSNGTDSPGAIDSPAALTVGSTQSFATANGTLTLTLMDATGTNFPGAEWLVFQYNTLNGVLLSPSQANWSLSEVGLQANQKLDIDAAFVQFSAGAAGPQTFTSSPFTGFSPTSAPPSDLTTVLAGPGLANTPSKSFIGGPGPLPSLGTFLDPFSQLDGHGVASDTVTGYTEALEFSPVSITPPPTIPEPRTWVMLGLGFAGLTFIGWRRKRTPRILME